MLYDCELVILQELTQLPSVCRHRDAWKGPVSLLCTSPRPEKCHQRTTSSLAWRVCCRGSIRPICMRQFPATLCGRSRCPQGCILKRARFSLCHCACVKTMRRRCKARAFVLVRMTTCQTSAIYRAVMMLPGGANAWTRAATSRKTVSHRWTPQHDASLQTKTHMYANNRQFWCRGNYFAFITLNTEKYLHMCAFFGFLYCDLSARSKPTAVGVPVCRRMLRVPRVLCSLCMHFVAVLLHECVVCVFLVPLCLPAHDRVVVRKCWHVAR